MKLLSYGLILVQHTLDLLISLCLDNCVLVHFQFYFSIAFYCLGN